MAAAGALALCGAIIWMLCGRTALALEPLLARPTAAQLRWQELEIGALIHFNMATYAPGGTRPGAQCSPDPDTFNPAQLDTDQWVRAFEAFGCREAVLVVKHNCGFVTWPTNATQADGTRYNYSVAYSKWRGGKGDVVGDFAASCLKRGLGIGYYYSGSQAWQTGCPPDGRRRAADA